MENLQLALTLLLAGFVIVFIVLILLIFIITLYGKIIQSAQHTVENKKNKQQVQKNKIISAAEKPAIQASVSDEPENSDEIPEEIVAVIAAAVDALYGTKPHKIKSVKRSRSVRSAWGNAGLAENTKPF